MARILAIVNNKGGTGKTTTTINVAGALAKLGFKTLIIDMDPQGNSSMSFMPPLDMHSPSPIGQFMLKQKNYHEVVNIDYSERLHIIPASKNLSEQEKMINTLTSPALALKTAFKRAKLAEIYDYVIIDCPPALSTLTNNALALAEKYLIPMDGKYFSYGGYVNVINHAEEVGESTSNDDLTLAGLVFINYNPKQRNAIRHKIVERIKSDPSLEGFVFQTNIREDKHLERSPMATQTVFEFAPDSPGANDYMQLTKEIISKYEQQ